MRFRSQNALFRASCCAVALSMFSSTVVLGAEALSPVTIVAPPDKALVGGRNVNVSAQFNTGNKKVDSVCLRVDGKVVNKTHLNPTINGTGNVNWDTTSFADGSHELIIELISGKKVVGRGHIWVTINNGPMDVVPPIVSFFNLKSGSTVSGDTRISIDAWDNVGISYVQLFIDNGIKLISNSQPFTYVWDTTSYDNGAHTLVATAYDAADNKGFSKPFTLIVNNPIGGSVASIESAPEEVASTPAPVEAPAVKVAEVPSTPPVVSIPIAPKSRVEIAGNAAPSLIAPGASPVMMAAAPKISFSSTPAPAAKISAPKSAPMIVSAAPAAKTSVILPSGRSAEPVAIPAPAPVRAASAPKAAAVPVLPQAVQMADARISISPSNDLSTTPSELARSEVAPGVANTRSAAMSSRPVMKKIIQPSGKPSLASNPVSYPVPTVESGILMAKAEPVFSAQKPAVAPKNSAKVVSAPKVAAKVDLGTTSVPELVSPVAKSVATAPVRMASKPASTPVAKKMTVAAPKSVQMAKLPPVRDEAQCMYVVKSGETLEDIAAKTHMTPESIKRVNPSSKQLFAGEQIRIPMGIRMVMDRHDMAFAVAPRFENGYAVAPLREIVERSGGTVNWDSKKHRVSALRGLNQIVLEIGSKEAQVNGVNVVMEVAPYVESGHTLVPLRFVEGSLEIAVEFDPFTRTIYMTSL